MMMGMIGPTRPVVAPGFSALINFRATSGYVTDGVGQTYCLDTDAYPTVRAGLTFGWETIGSINPSSADRDNTRDPRLAGINYGSQSGSGNGPIFRLDLPSSGAYNCDMASGDTFNQPGSYEYLFKDTSSTVKTVSNTVGVVGNHWIDINNTDFTPASAWVSGHVPAAVTFTTTIFRFVPGVISGSPFWTLAHLSVTS